MPKFLFSIRIAALLPAVGTVVGAQTVRAESLVIWSPVKVSSRTYKTTVGFRLPMAWETSAGADVALGSSPGGQILTGTEQATLWGKIAKESGTSASRYRQEVAVRVDTLRGSSALLLSRSRSFILSESFDMEMSRSLGVGYDRQSTRQASINASQALKLIYPWTGTALLAHSTLTDVRGDFSTTVGFSQNILPNLSLGASVTDPLSSQQASGVNVRYQIKW